MQTLSLKVFAKEAQVSILDLLVLSPKEPELDFCGQQNTEQRWSTWFSSFHSSVTECPWLSSFQCSQTAPSFPQASALGMSVLPRLSDDLPEK